MVKMGRYKMGGKKINLEERKTLENDMKSVIWQRDKRICAKCGRFVYMTQKPKGNVHHVDIDRANNKASNLVLLCSNCHQKVHHLYKRSIYEYNWEMRQIDGVECNLLSGDSEDRYPRYSFQYTRQRIDELEYEAALLALPVWDLIRLGNLKALETELIMELKKPFKANKEKAKEEWEEA